MCVCVTVEPCLQDNSPEIDSREQSTSALAGERGATPVAVKGGGEGDKGSGDAAAAVEEPGGDSVATREGVKEGVGEEEAGEAERQRLQLMEEEQKKLQAAEDAQKKAEDDRKKEEVRLVWIRLWRLLLLCCCC